jgi:hypothetical protein
MSADQLEKLETSDSTVTENKEEFNKVYRVLTGISPKNSERETYFFKQLMTRACLEDANFSRDLPNGEIVSAREIVIPVEKNFVDPEVQVEKVKETTDAPKVINGIVYNSESKYENYKSLEKFVGSFHISGYCYGSEYILR